MNVRERLVGTALWNQPQGGAGRANFRQLITLRWLAAAGQLLTILIVWLGMGVRLPVLPMLAVVGFLVLLNLVSTARLEKPSRVRTSEILSTLLLDVLALSVMLYLSGGATNPFVSVFLVQVVLGAILLDTRSSLVLVAATASCFLVLVLRHRPLILSDKFHFGLFDLYIIGTFCSFLMVAALLVYFVTRINANLRARDARLAALRQQAVEDDHIVRMGLLASGAAHELGTPLAVVSVLVNDWAKMPRFANDPELAEDIGEMQTALNRCKAIVTGILLSAGEARGEAPVVTALGSFLRDVGEEWRTQNSGRSLALHDEATRAEDLDIVADPALKQVIWNVLDNARDASQEEIQLVADRTDTTLIIEVRDSGTGFAQEMLANLGRPYYSTKNRPGGGLGLFLVSNVMRKFGGSIEARNRSRHGAAVRLTFPLKAIAIARKEMDDG